MQICESAAIKVDRKYRTSTTAATYLSRPIKNISRGRQETIRERSISISTIGANDCCKLMQDLEGLGRRAI